MSTRMNELGNPFTNCLLNDLRLPFQADRAGTPVYLPRHSSRDEHTLLTPCFQRFRRAASNVANLSQIAQRAGSVRPHGVVFLHHLGKGDGECGKCSSLRHRVARFRLHVICAASSRCVLRTCRGTPLRRLRLSVSRAAFPLPPLRARRPCVSPVACRAVRLVDAVRLVSPCRQARALSYSPENTERRT